MRILNQYKLLTHQSQYVMLVKKEAQNARLVEKLVPKRNRYPKDQAALEARANEKRKQLYGMRFE